MELVVADQIRLRQAADGSTWASGWGGYAHFAAYQAGFERVSIACRLEHVTGEAREGVRCDGPAVSFVGLPHYVGPWQYLRSWRSVQRRLSALYRPDAAYILRMPSQIGTLFMRRLVSAGHPFGVVVVADPFKDFQRESCGHPAWRALQWRYTKALRAACRSAAAVAYVTARSLQAAYPPGGGFVTSFSDAVLTDDWFVQGPRLLAPFPEVGWTLMHIGAFNQLYKAQDILLRALAICRSRGVRFKARLVGGGRYLPTMRRLSKDLGLETVTEFLGEVPHGAGIRSLLDESDLFLLPSRTEGLPRALLEAMARGVPCLGSNVGGIPELLDPACLVPPERPDLLSDRILEVLSQPARLSAMSARNLEVARHYHWEKMAPQRRTFLEYLRGVTESWVRTRDAESKRG